MRVRAVHDGGAEEFSTAGPGGLPAAAEKFVPFSESPNMMIVKRKKNGFPRQGAAYRCGNPLKKELAPLKKWINSD